MVEVQNGWSSQRLKLRMVGAQNDWKFGTHNGWNS